MPVLTSIVSPASIWSTFGLLQPATGSGSDNAALSGTLGSQFAQYRDIKLTGTLTAGFSPQILVCRQLDLNGNIIDSNGLGAVGGAGAIQSPSTNADAGAGILLPSTNVTTNIAPAAGVPYDLAHLLVAGGAGVGRGTNGNVGVAASAQLESLIAAVWLFGAYGGGGGGGGGVTTGTGGSNGTGGRRGGRGSNSSNPGRGSPGGSGIGGGGSGGGGSTSSAGTNGGTGGTGGGVIIVICDDIVGTAGTIRANGNAGQSGVGTNAGGGGGGGGGLCLVFARHVVTTPTVTANGGAGGAKNGDGGDGGQGGAGLARLVRAA